MVAGNENAAATNNGKETNENPNMQKDAEARKETKTPKKQEQKPVLGQQQQGKPSRTDNCHCPEVSVIFHTAIRFLLEGAVSAVTRIKNRVLFRFYLTIVNIMSFDRF